ncbi:MAG: hypothetical protein K5872_08545 [Rhizobiaceae bacterium]|nr:hypothetical protein [Rhizobiaceae bacterium]MCV0406264.1 hypothetical protein [Rhizobiaceae bacterium]
MSDDPETARQIAELARDDRPLLVLDVDDVILEFIRPFPMFLRAKGYELRLETPRLNGNIIHVETGLAAETEAVGGLIDAFFEAQAEWQELMADAADTLASFKDSIEIVLLTAMPHRHRETRRAHLDALGLDYPLVTTEMAKGPAVRSLRGKGDRRVAFVDDQPRNLVSTRESVPDARLFHLMADNSLRTLFPPPPDYVEIVDDWIDARPKIAEALGL